MQFQIVAYTVAFSSESRTIEFEPFCTVESPKQFLPMHPHYFYANLDKLQDPYLLRKCGGTCNPQTWLHYGLLLFVIL